MSLDLGSLVGYLELDDSKFQGPLDKLPESVRGKVGLMVGAGAIVGAALSAAIIGGVNDALDFESTNALAAAKLGLLPEEAARVGTLAGQLYSQNYGESMAEAQTAVAGVVAGIQGMGEESDEVVERSTAKILNYATAFDQDLADSIGQVDRLISTGLASSAEEAVDLMTASMQRVPEALRGDMRDAIDEYGPFLAELGLSGEEAFDLFVQGSERGMYGIDKAGDSLKEFTIRATDMSTASVDAYAALGLNAEDMSARVLAGGDDARGAFDQIVDGLLGMENPAERANTAIALFGTPLEDLGTSQIPEFLTSLQDLGGGMDGTAGAADRMDEQMFDTGKNGVETFQRQSELLFAALGEHLLPIITEVFGFLNENPAVLQVIIAALGVFALAVIGLTVATWAMNTALLANPITWIVIGIVALIAALVLLIMNWDAVVAWVSEVWGGFIGWLGEVVDGFVSWWSEVWQGFVDFFTGLWDGLVAWVTAVWEGFIGWIMDGIRAYITFWNAGWQGVGDFFTNLWDSIVSWVTGVWGGFLGWIRGVISAYVSFWIGVWGGVLDFIVGVWNSIVDSVTTAWDNIMGFLGGVPDAIGDIFAGAGEWLMTIGGDIIDGLLEGLKGAIGAVWDWISGIGEGIADTFAGILGINSPSTVFRGFGLNIGEGLVEGLAEIQPTVDARIGRMVEVPSSSSPGSSSVNTSTSKTVNYYAPPGSAGLSAEEQLFAAMSRGRGEF